MAVLYRSHFHALELQLELTRRQHPVQHHERDPVFRAGAHQGCDGVFEAGDNPRDELSFKRLAQLLPGIGGKGAEKFWKTFEAQSRQSAAEPRSPTPDGPASPPRPSPLRLQACAANGAEESGGGLGAVDGDHRAAGSRKECGSSAAKMIRLVIEAGYDDYLKENLRQLPLAAGGSGAAGDFCANSSRPWRIF